MTGDPGDVLDDLFHGCALTAFLEQAARERTWPDPEATRRLAYRLYEDELKRKNGPATGEVAPHGAGSADSHPR